MARRLLVQQAFKYGAEDDLVTRLVSSDVCIPQWSAEKRDLEQ